jgi:hypothetical protein
MIVTVQQSGGFAGIRPPPSVVDTEKVAPDHADAIHKAAQAVRQTPAPAAAGARPQPDRFQYRVTIADAGQEHTVVAPEGSSPQLDALVRAVRAASGK